MKYFLKCLCFYLVCLLPLTIQAKPTGTVVFQHPENYNELWITNIENTANARLFYKHTDMIWTSATQKDGNLIVLLSNSDDVQPIGVDDIYLFNTDHMSKGARNLTQKRFDFILDVDISEAGDIIFTNERILNELIPKDGVYLIPNYEIEKPVPKVKLVREVEAMNVVWARDGKQIAYDVPSKSVYTFNIETQSILKVNHFGEVSRLFTR